MGGRRRRPDENRGTPPASAAATPFEYTERLEELMNQQGHSYRSIEAYAHAHGDHLPRSTFHAVIKKAALHKELPPREFVTAFVRACFCRTYGLPMALDKKRLPPSDLCRCKQPEVHAWLALYDHLASTGPEPPPALAPLHSEVPDPDTGSASEPGSGDVPPQAEDGDVEGRAPVKQRWARWRERQLSRGGFGVLLGLEIHRQLKPTNVVPGLAHTYSVYYGKQQLGLDLMPGIVKRDLPYAAAMVAGVSRPFEGRMAKFLQKLAAQDPDIVAQLLQVIAETYPVKAVRLSERAGIPLPTTSNDEG